MRNTLLLGIGATLMYYFDPSWGRRRRAQLRERLEGALRQIAAARERAERASACVDAAGPHDDEDTDIDWTRGYSYRDRLAQSSWP